MAHDHHHHHGHGGHAHGHAAPASVASFSLLQASALQRVMLAAIPVGGLWGLVWWAMR